MRDRHEGQQRGHEREPGDRRAGGDGDRLEPDQGLEHERHRQAETDRRDRALARGALPVEPDRQRGDQRRGEEPVAKDPEEGHEHP